MDDELEPIAEDVPGGQFPRQQSPVLGDQASWIDFGPRFVLGAGSLVFWGIVGSIEQAVTAFVARPINNIASGDINVLRGFQLPLIGGFTLAFGGLSGPPVDSDLRPGNMGIFDREANIAGQDVVNLGPFSIRTHTTTIMDAAVRLDNPVLNFFGPRAAEDLVHPGRVALLDVQSGLALSSQGFDLLPPVRSFVRPPENQGSSVLPVPANPESGILPAPGLINGGVEIPHGFSFVSAAQGPSKVRPAFQSRVHRRRHQPAGSF